MFVDGDETATEFSGDSNGTIEEDVLAAANNWNMMKKVVAVLMKIVVIIPPLCMAVGQFVGFVSVGA